MLPRDAIQIQLIAENHPQGAHPTPPFWATVVATVDGFDFRYAIDGFGVLNDDEQHDYSDVLTDGWFQAIAFAFEEWSETQSAHTRLRAAALLAGTVC